MALVQSLKTAHDQSATVPPSIAYAPAGNLGLRNRLVAIDAAALVVAWSISRLVLHGTDRPAFKSLILMAISVLIGLTVIRAHDLYRSRIASIRAVELARLARASAVMFALTLAVNKMAERFQPVSNP